MTEDINERQEDGLRYLPSDLLRGEWDLLLRRMAAIGTTRSLTNDHLPGGKACLVFSGAKEDLPELDRLAMTCLVIDPLYREEQEDGHLFMATFRTWWRRSVPFLMDPDGPRHYYRYAVQEGVTVPPEEM